MQVLTEDQCRKAIESGKLELAELTGQSGLAAVILTQSWCPQWRAMKNYLPEAEKQLPGLEIVYVEYDKISFFEEFMAFKEDTFNNREIPFVLYYKNGVNTSRSNFISLEGFLGKLRS